MTATMSYGTIIVAMLRAGLSVWHKNSLLCQLAALLPETYLVTHKLEINVIYVVIVNFFKQTLQMK